MFLGIGNEFRMFGILPFYFFVALKFCFYLLIKSQFKYKLSHMMCPIKSNDSGKNKHYKIRIFGKWDRPSYITFKKWEGSVWRSAAMFAIVHAPVCKLQRPTETEKGTVIIMLNYSSWRPQEDGEQRQHLSKYHIIIMMSPPKGVYFYLLLLMAPKGKPEPPGWVSALTETRTDSYKLCVNKHSHDPSLSGIDCDDF